MRFKRVLLKLSGGALENNSNIFDSSQLKHIANVIIGAYQNSIEISIVVGGGNIFRGRTAEEWNINRVEADNIGMLSTVINSLMLKSVLESESNIDIKILTSISMFPIAEPYMTSTAIKYLENKSIVIFGGGIGQPFMSTDYPSVQRAIEVNADVVLMAKNGVDGVYSNNPNKDLKAKKYKSITYNEALKKNLQVIDQTAFVLAREYKMPLYIFDFNENNSITRICNGEELGTLVN